MSECRSCGAEILWAATSRGTQMPLDVDPLDIPAPGLVAFNPATGVARVLSHDDMLVVPRWRDAGATLHRAHFATCPHAASHRVNPAQEALL